MGKEWAGLFFPRGKNGPAHSFPGEKTDWGEIPACYTGILIFRWFYSIQYVVKPFTYTFGFCQSKMATFSSLFVSKNMITKIRKACLKRKKNRRTKIFAWGPNVSPGLVPLMVINVYLNCQLTPQLSTTQFGS